MSTVEEAVELAREIAKVSEGFGGTFQFDPEHIEDASHDNITAHADYDDRLMYVPDGADVRDHDASLEIACGIEPHVAAPMAAMLNAAGPLARALLELAERYGRLEAVAEAARRNMDATKDTWAALDALPTTKGSTS